MTKAAVPSRWFSGWRAPRAVADTDPADLGTCFGLEMSLDDEPPPPVRPTPDPRRGPRAWVRRLTGRPRAAG